MGGIQLKFINSHKNMFIVIILLILILLFIFVYVSFVSESKPEKIIRKKINLKLSDEVEIVHFKHSKSNEDSIKAKIHIKEKDIVNILEQFHDESIYPQNHGYKEGTVIPNFINSCDWFTISEENIMHVFRTIRTDKEFNDKGVHYIWAFICCEDGDYYLYLSF